MAAKKKPNPATVVRRTVRNHTTPAEARGVINNLREGGSTRKKQLTYLRTWLRGEVQPGRRRTVMDAARAVKTNKDLHRFDGMS